MIAVVELTSTGQRHAPFNAMLLRTVLLAAPGVCVQFWAEKSHIDRVRDLLRRNEPALTFHSIELTDYLPEKVTLVSLGRLWRDLRTLVRVVCRSSSQPMLLIASSGSATGITAAWLTRWLPGNRARAVHFIMHGELSGINDTWRSRNPLLRYLSLKSVLRRCHSPAFRYVVLETSIRQALETLVPTLRHRIDVFPIPVNDIEASVGNTVTPAHPIEIGMVGIATRSKGFDRYARLAERIGRETPDRVRFHVVGPVHPEFSTMDMRWLAPPVGFANLERADFVDRVRRLHFVCLPYGGAYYELAASASLLDAITCCKPVIVMATSLTQQLFAAYGDIGYLCYTEEDMHRTLLDLARTFDPARYTRQIDAITRVHESRTPPRLAVGYREAMKQLLPGHLPG